MALPRVTVTEEMLAEAVGSACSPAQVKEAVEQLAAGDGKFRSGTRRIPVALRREAQRLRMLLAMLRACAELGYRDVNVQTVLELAGVSRPTFYEYFDNKEDCFLIAFDFAAARLLREVEAAASAAGEDGQGRLRMGLVALLRFVAAEPDAAGTLIVEARAASPAAQRRHVELLDRFASCIDSAASGKSSEPPSAISAAAIVGGIEAVLYARLNRGELGDLEALLPSLLSFLALPYEDD